MTLGLKVKKLEKSRSGGLTPPYAWQYGLNPQNRSVKPRGLRVYAFFPLERACARLRRGFELSRTSCGRVTSLVRTGHKQKSSGKMRLRTAGRLAEGRYRGGPLHSVHLTPNYRQLQLTTVNYTKINFNFSDLFKPIQTYSNQKFSFFNLHASTNLDRSRRKTIPRTNTPLIKTAAFASPPLINTGALARCCGHSGHANCFNSFPTSHLKSAVSDRGCGASPAAVRANETERAGLISTRSFGADTLRLGLRHSRGPSLVQLGTGCLRLATCHLTLGTRPCPLGPFPPRHSTLDTPT